MAVEAATLIGDLVGSRGSDDRAALHARLDAALTAANDRFAPVTDLRITVGDEYQGAFGSIGAAARASLFLRISLLPEYDVRHGLSWGEVSVLQAEPRVEDGPGWWAARDAVHVVERAEQRPATRNRRTAFRLPKGTASPEAASEAAWVEASLLLRDVVVSGLSARSLSVLRGLLDGRSQREIADELEISPSAVSQRVRTDGLAALVAADEVLEVGAWTRL